MLVGNSVHSFIDSHNSGIQCSYQGSFSYIENYDIEVSMVCSSKFTMQYRLSKKFRRRGSIRIGIEINIAVEPRIFLIQIIDKE